jgi:putative Mn2+ efflux pump MntP
VLTLGTAHALFFQRRQVERQLAVAGTPSRLPRQLSQVLFAGLLIGGWIASLGLVAPLAAVDHWVAFALLAGLGWKLIHGAVRPRRTPDTPGVATIGLILLLTALTGAHVVAASIPWTLILVPGSLLLAAVLLLLAAPVLAKRTVSNRVRRLAEARVAIASGLLLVGIAVQILIEHLA